MIRRWSAALLAVLALLVLSVGCGSTAPTGPSPSPVLGASTERRVDSVGGGQAECFPPQPCPPPRSFELEVADGSTFAGDCVGFSCFVRAGTGRFEGIFGTGTVGVGASTLGFELFVSGPSTGRQIFMMNASELPFTRELISVPASRCSTGLLDVFVAPASIEHLGQSVMTVSICSL